MGGAKTRYDLQPKPAEGKFCSSLQKEILGVFGVYVRKNGSTCSFDIMSGFFRGAEGEKKQKFQRGKWAK